MTPTSPSPFPRFVAASGLTNLADGVAVVLWAWTASLLTRDPLLVAVLPVALRLPWFLFAIPAGIITDRVDRKRLILAMDAVRAVAFAGAAIAVWMTLPLADAPDSGVAHPWLYGTLVTLALFVGAAEVFRDNAAQTMLPALVPHDTLERANGRLWSVELVGNALLGPALGAVLIALVLWLPFALNALAFVAALALVSTLRGRFQPDAPSNRNWRRELAEGLAFLRDAPLLRLLALVTGLWNLLDQIMLVALLLYAQEVLSLGPEAYGLMLAAGAVGGILGGVLSDRVVSWLGPGRTAQWAMFGSACMFAAIPFAPNAVVLALILATGEFVGLMWNTVSVSYRQRTIPDALLGRVNSLYRLLAWGMMPVGLILSGLIMRWAEPWLGREAALTLPFLVVAAGTILLTLLTWRVLGRRFAQ